MQPRRYSRRSQETHRCPDRHGRIQDPVEEMVREHGICLRPASVVGLGYLRHIERLRRYTTYKDHITLADYEIHDGMSLEMY